MAVHIDSPRDSHAILGELRKSCRPSGEGEAAHALRVATLNFIVFVDDPSHRQWVLDRAARVADKHPSRLIVLDSTGGTSGVDVSTSKRETAGDTVVNERVDIGVRSLDHASIISLVQELSLPDVETFLWWSGARLLASRTFSGLAHLAAGVLVDSSGKVRGDEIIAELAVFRQRFPHVNLHDLAFMRLSPWRDMIAQFFDDSALREDLFSIRELQIESGSEAEALYLAGWLGSRLSWEAVDRTTFRDRRGSNVRFTKTDRGEQRRVVRVSLIAGESTYTAALSEEDAATVCLDVTGARAKPTRWSPLRNIDNTSLIERAILENPHDEVFETSLQTVRDLLQ